MNKPSYSEQDFKRFVEHLKPNEHSNLFVGFNHHEISEILQDTPFYTKERQHIPDLKALYDHLGPIGYHRLLPPYHPPVNFEGKPNMTVQIKSLRIEYYDKMTNKLKLNIELVALWEVALSEFREGVYTDDGGTNLPTYPKLPSDSQMHIFKQNASKDKSFTGPGLLLKATEGPRDAPFYAGEDLEPAKFIFKTANPLPGKKRYGKFVKFQFQSRAVHTYDVVTEGNYKEFPFDTKTIVLHFTSDVINSQIKFKEPDNPNDIKKIVQSLKARSRTNEWITSERDIDIKLLHRDLHFKDWPQDPQHTKRSKIVLTARFKRSWPYWFMKMVLPMDIITFIGISVLLLVPAIGDVGPSASERIAMVGLTVSVLLAQAAFTIAVQPMLPDIAYVTIMDIHNNFCFLVTAAESITFAVIPADLWAIFRKSPTIYLVWGAAQFILLAEQLVLCYPLLLRKAPVTKDSALEEVVFGPGGGGGPT